MVTVVHLLTGAVIGAYLDAPPAIFITAFFSHYLLDMLPHVDPNTFNTDRLLHTWTQRISLAVDIIVGILVTVLLLATHQRWPLIIIGSIAALIPDLVIPLENKRWFSPIKDLHHLCHWDHRYAQRWRWYIAGLAAPAVIGIGSLVIIMATH